MIKNSKLFIFSLILILFSNANASEIEKIKIGLLVPTSNENYEFGQTIIKAVRMAMNDINSDKIEIIIKDSKKDPTTALRSSMELKQQGVNLVIGPGPITKFTPCCFSSIDDLSAVCLLYTSPSPRDRTRSRMPSSA